MTKYTEGENVTLKSTLKSIATIGTIERIVSAGYMVRVQDLKAHAWAVIFFDETQIERI